MRIFFDISHVTQLIATHGRDINYLIFSNKLVVRQFYPRLTPILDMVLKFKQ